MPSYIVTSKSGRLTGSQKSQVAEAITRAHGDATGAPYYFARVTFSDVKASDYFLGGTRLDTDQIFVHGTIREGRPTDMKNTLTARLTTDVALACQMNPNCVWVYLSELPPSQMIEFGRPLPLHGKEAEWSAALPDVEKSRLESIGIRTEIDA